MLMEPRGTTGSHIDGTRGSTRRRDLDVLTGDRLTPHQDKLVQMLLMSVYETIPSQPISRPTPDAFIPPHGAAASRKGGRLIHTVPALISCASRLAVPISRDQMTAPNP